MPTDEQITTIFRAIKTNLHSDFLNSKSLAEREKIFKISEETTRKLYKSHYSSLIRVSRIIPITLIISVAAPFIDAKSLLLTMKFGLFLFGLDDLFDEKLLNTSELLKRVHNYREIIHNRQPLGDGHAKDDLATLLQEIYDGFQTYRNFKKLKGEWTYSMTKLIDAMLDEYHWKLEAENNNYSTLPSVEDYLTVSSFSGGTPAYVWSMLMLINDDTIFDHVRYLHHMELLASRCIRIANEIESYEREIKENKINATLLYKHQHNEKDAESWLKNLLDKNMNELLKLHQQKKTQSGLAEDVIKDVALFTCEFYQNFDFHTFNKLVTQYSRPLDHPAKTS